MAKHYLGLMYYLDENHVPEFVESLLETFNWNLQVQRRRMTPEEFLKYWYSEHIERDHFDKDVLGLIILYKGKYYRIYTASSFADFIIHKTDFMKKLEEFQRERQTESKKP